MENNVAEEIRNDTEAEENMETNDEAEDDIEIEKAANKGKYKLRRPITFEGKEIKYLPLKELENITGKDIEDALNLMRVEGTVKNREYDSVYDSTAFRFAIYRLKTNTIPELLQMLHSVDYIILQQVVGAFLFKLG